MGFLTIGALALLGIIGAYWTWEWFAPRPVPRAPSRLPADIQVGAAASLFGSAPSMAISMPSASTDALRLAGVVASDGGRDAYAIVVLNNQQVVAAKPGDEVSPGVLLVEIAARHVVLDRNGARESLTLPEKSQAAVPALPRANR